MILQETDRSFRTGSLPLNNTPTYQFPIHISFQYISVSNTYQFPIHISFQYISVSNTYQFPIHTSFQYISVCSQDRVFRKKFAHGISQNKIQTEFLFKGSFLTEKLAGWSIGAKLFVLILMKNHSLRNIWKISRQGSLAMKSKCKPSMKTWSARRCMIRKPCKETVSESILRSCFQLQRHKKKL